MFDISKEASRKGHEKQGSRVVHMFVSIKDSNGTPGTPKWKCTIAGCGEVRDSRGVTIEGGA